MKPNGFDKTTHTLMSKIRDYVNSPWKHYLLMRDRNNFSKLCASMDVIEDAGDAIAAYEENQFGQGKSNLYLAIYGVLQALIVQQDGVIHLRESLGMEQSVKNYQALKEIREIRNDAVGHPTKRDRKKGEPISYHHISQMTMRHSGFEMLTFYHDGRFQHTDINLDKIISEQREFISAILSTTILELQEEAVKHKETFRMEKLVGIIPEIILYHCEKVLESLDPSQSPDFGLINLRMIEDTFEKFRDSVGRRDMALYESFEHEYQLIDHATLNLRQFFEAQKQGDKTLVDPLTADIFALFIRSKVIRLKQYAEEIDNDYM